MILTVQNLDISNCSHKIVKQVSFSIREGERVGIVGESGSGKTLLVRSIIGLLPPSISITGGTIQYQESLLSSMEERELQAVRGKEIGMIFQDPLTFLNPTTPVGVQIAEGCKKHCPHLDSKERALLLLEKVGISEPARRFGQLPHQLSGGQRQRVLIAIALSAQPKLLIADEPTTALDFTTQTQIMDLLRTLQLTTLLISHDLDLITSFCDRILVMYAGEIVEEFSKAPKHPYTQQLLQAIPSLHPQIKLVPIPGAPPDLSKPIQGCPFAPRCAQVFDKCLKEAPPPFQTVRCWRSSC